VFGAPYPGALSELRLRTLVAAYEELNGGEAAHVTLQTLHQLGWVVNLDGFISIVLLCCMFFEILIARFTNSDRSNPRGSKCGARRIQFLS
jgi:hypothetical protein